jgi:hypothetical protein
MSMDRSPLPPRDFVTRHGAAITMAGVIGWSLLSLWGGPGWA